jgi:hypothetical protein
MSKLILCNHYSKKGSHLFANNLHLILSERSKTTAKKAATFLLAVNSKTDKRSYISSLYPISQTSYTFDYVGLKYILSFSDDSAEIMKIA